MSKALEAAAGVVLIAAAIFTAGTIPGPWTVLLMQAGNALLFGAALGAAAQLFSGSGAPRAPPMTGIGISYAGTLEPRRILYGTLKVGGMYCIPPLTSGANNDFFHSVLALAGHPVDFIGDIFFDQIRIPSGKIQSIAGNANDGHVGGIPTPPAGQVNGAPYNGIAWVRRYDGSQTTVDYILNNAFTAWDSNHIGKGIAYIALQFQHDQNIFSSGPPQVTALVRGKRIYDPRLDSTNGGSGSQRYTTPSTWTYSTNPVLCLRDYLTSSLGLGEANTRIDDALVRAAAAICDQTCTVPIPMVEGLTNWTSGSTTVTGMNTFFTLQLATGNYIRGPNGTMYLISTITSDYQLTIIPGYGGSTASAQVSTYNTTNATSTTQKRYTCNTALDATARFEDNINTLCNAMQGHCLYSGGKWLIYAGAWSSSAFTLAEDDLVGGVSIQCTTPRKDLYNSVRGNFIDPTQNYQPAEFPQITNSVFVTEDGGEVIYVETNFPCCTNSYEAQRNAIALAQRSRNRRVVTAQFGMSAFRVRPYETGVVTINEIGWVTQTVRCLSWKFLPQGAVELSLQEAYAADFTDPLIGDYSITGINNTPLPQHYLPYPPTALVAAGVPGGIHFDVTLPDQVLPGTRIQLMEYTAATPFSAATIIAEATTTHFDIARDPTPRYYWVRTAGPKNPTFGSIQVSGSYPSTTGVTGTAGVASNEWIAAGDVVENGKNIWKFGVTNAWDAAEYTAQGHTDCHIQGKPSLISDFAMIGLSDSPAGSTNYTNGDYSWYNNNGTWNIYEGATFINSYGAVSIFDSVGIIYSGTSVTYFLNGVLKRTATTTAGRVMFGWAPVNKAGGGWVMVNFGPTGNFAINDTAQIRDDAVSQMLGAYNASGAVATYGNGTSTVDYSGSVSAFGFSASIDTTGAPVAVDLNVGNFTIFASTGTSSWSVVVDLYRDGASLPHSPSQSFTSTQLSWSANSYVHSAPMVMTVVDDEPPAAGTHIYGIRYSITVAGSSGTNSVGIFPVALKLREIKK